MQLAGSGSELIVSFPPSNVESELGKTVPTFLNHTTTKPHQESDGEDKHSENIRPYPCALGIAVCC